MITNFKVFEKIEYKGYHDENGNLITTNYNGDFVRYNKPDVNDYSDDFWNFIRVADWNRIIKTIHDSGFKNKKEVLKLKVRVFKKYEYDVFMSFNNEYDKLEKQLSEYFRPVWLDDKYDIFMPSDDGYSDLISSIIGRGKMFVKKCINDHNVFINMAKNNEYVENFGQIWQTTWKEYDEIRKEYDPLYRDINKFNI